MKLQGLNKGPVMRLNALKGAQSTLGKRPAGKPATGLLKRTDARTKNNSTFNPADLYPYFLRWLH